MRATGCRPWPTHRSHTAVNARSSKIMNVLTDALACLVHFIGWLV
ncbi:MULTISPECIES: hypothetical protein [unclassified Streptomyces]